MSYICTECGKEVPDDSDFCYYCGRTKENILEKDRPRGTGAVGICARCGDDIGPNDLFCQHCGQPISKAQTALFKPKITGKSWIGIFLALIPGVFNIFGLGHLFFKKWSRGAMYLAISAFLLYIQYFSGNESQSIFFFILQAGVYVVQAMEVLALAIISSGKKE